MDTRLRDGGYRTFAPAWLHERINAHPVPHAGTAEECQGALQSLAAAFYGA